MENLELNELTRGFRERMRRLALFDPLYDLDRKRVQDLEGTNIDMKGLGLLSLLFFFENMIMRQSKTGVKQLAIFLQKTTAKTYLVPEEKYIEVARTILETFRPTHGKKRSYSYFDWEHQEEQRIEYSILKANSFDVKTNTQYYALDEDGLELLFATKEFYNEFQLSINQLILRKQLDKGEFKGALRQINEMRIDVETLQERMVKMKHDIQRSIVSEETFERYKQLLEDIYRRLAREDEEFKELRQFVRETRERLYAQNVHQKEKKTYGYILKINHELEAVHYDHSHLLKQTLTLKNTTLITAQESLYYTGIQAFNFDQDLVSRIVSDAFPLEAMKGVLHPFLKVEENEQWSPLTILAEQNITEERKEKLERTFAEVDKNEEKDGYRRELIIKYKELMSLFLLAYEEEQVRTLSAFIDYLDRNSQSFIYEQRYFYDFWLILHQRSPINQGNVDEQEGKMLLSDALALIGNRTLKVKEGKGVIRKMERYSMQEMTIEWEGVEDALS
ncbi:replicative DNA helicase [Bacillus sp. FJAT-42315]|uniref:replicative DNA helicase n=1 Tax=Bacillus sp. FJAT-42315 TaxID=2014077 RepID=UPI000C251294|nr:replicative DNA helicase [Bacillus sp. FJAT-42315]